MKYVLPFGTWPSPVSPEMLTSGAVGLVDVWVDPNHDRTVWLESRPAEGGRLQIVVLEPDGSRRDLLPDGFSARTGVHEYGGGAAWVESGVAWFVNWADQRIYRTSVDGSQSPVALTDEPNTPRSTRFADIRRSPDGRWLVCVREQHLPDGEVLNQLVMLDAHQPSEPRLVFGASDFVMSPRFAAGDRLRFIAWDHPSMPWNDTTLYECSFDPVSGVCSEATVVTTGCSIMQPVGDLAIDDRSGWWNLWSHNRTGSTHRFPVDAEVGGPAWVFGERAYAVLDDQRLVYSLGGDLVIDGVRHPTDAVSFGQFTTDGTNVTAIARYDDRHPAIVRFHADSPEHLDTVVEPPHTELAPGDISIGVEIEYPTGVAATAYAWFYPPTNAAVEGPGDAAPPLVVMIHGGPTSRAERAFAISRQFWTSRGFAVVDVNHRGSTGYGTAFRNLLDANWGVVDVEDCCAAANWLAAKQWVDGSRMVIRGGSAGGFTVLSCLASSDLFATGANLYGVADLSTLATDTHKFEARYLDRLVGPWPEARDIYEQRSPIHHLDDFSRPLITFQGLDDMVVPPSQSEAVVAALRSKGIECGYRAYEGEGHGFRKAETIVDQLTRELDFYRRVLSLEQ